MTNYNSTLTINTEHNLLDNLNKLRVSTLTTILDIRHTHNLKNYLYEVESSTLNTNALYNDTNGPATILSLISAINENNITRQSREYVVYQQGRSILVYIVVNLNPNTNNDTNSEGRIGYFDDNNGIFFKHTGDMGTGNMSVVIRFNGIDTEINQTNWNIDKMDGVGPSGITANFNEIHTYFIEISWDHIIRMGMLISGKLEVVHQFYDQSSTLLIKKSNLPVRYSLTASGVVLSANLAHYSTYVSSDTGYNPIGRIYAINNISNIIKINNIEKPILTLRHKNFNINKGKIKPLNIILSSSDYGNIIYKIYKYNSPLSIPIMGLTSLDFITEGTLTEYALGGTTIDTLLDNSKILLFQDLFSGNTRFDFDNMYKDNSLASLSADIASNTDYLIITCQLISGITTKGITILFSWIEYMS